MPKKTKKYTYSVGRRRSASARVRLYRGRERSVVNGMPIEKYFPGLAAKTIWSRPFKLMETEKKYFITAKVKGGGKNGQLEALVHAIARAFSKAKPDKFKTPLKKAGLLTRDPRVRERRKVGMGGKARRKRQSPKR